MADAMVNPLTVNPDFTDAISAAMERKKHLNPSTLPALTMRGVIAAGYFGSRCYNLHRPQSDIDVILITHPALSDQKPDQWVDRATNRDTIIAPFNHFLEKFAEGNMLNVDAVRSPHMRYVHDGWKHFFQSLRFNPLAYADKSERLIRNNLAEPHGGVFTVKHALLAARCVALSERALRGGVTSFSSRFNDEEAAWLRLVAGGIRAELLERGWVHGFPSRTAAGEGLRVVRRHVLGE